MKVLKRVRWAYLVLSIFLIAIGVCLILFPEISMSMACCIIGGGAMVFGLAKIVIYFVRHVDSMVEQYDFSAGVLCIIAGAVLLIHPEDVLRLIPQVLAVYMICDCVFKMQVVLDAKRLGSGSWILQLLVLLVCLAWGVCLVLQPFGLDQYVSAMVAGGLIADGVQNLLAVILIAAVVKKPAAQGGPVENIPDPMAVIAQKSMTSAYREPEPEIEDVVESGPEIKDLIEESKEQSNQPEGKGGIFKFFNKG